MTTLLPDRFWELVQVDDNTGCWLWSGKTSPKGYPVFGRRAAWKYAYELLHQPIPDYGTYTTIEGCEGNLFCANPDHRLGTPRDLAHVRHRCTVCKQWHDPD